MKFDEAKQLQEMALARTGEMEGFIKRFPDVVDVYQNPDHKKNGTKANEDWHNYIDLFFELYPDNVELGNKTKSKTFSDTIFHVMDKRKKMGAPVKAEPTADIDEAYNKIGEALSILEEGDYKDTLTYKSLSNAYKRFKMEIK